MAPIIKSSRLQGLIVRFVFCNLSGESEELLADAFAANAFLVGFTCIQNPHNYDPNTYEYKPTASVKKLEEAAVRCPSPYLLIFQNRGLSDDLNLKRSKVAQSPSVSSSVPAKQELSPLNTPTKSPQSQQTKNPLEEEKLKSDDQILSSFLEIAKNGKEFAPWQRSKIMMVGQGRAGKSSFVRSFLGQPFDSNLKSTNGADTSSVVTVDRQDVHILKSKGRGQEPWVENHVTEEYLVIAARATVNKMSAKSKDTKCNEQLLVLDGLKEKMPPLNPSSSDSSFVSTDTTATAPAPPVRKSSLIMMNSSFFRRQSKTETLNTKSLERSKKSTPPSSVPIETQLPSKSSTSSSSLPAVTQLLPAKPFVFEEDLPW